MTVTTDPADAWTEQADTRISHKYHIDYSRPLGTGTGTVVRRCVDRGSGRRCAVKTVSKCRPRQVQRLRDEVARLRELDHPGVIGLVDVYENRDYLHVVTELCAGGEVLKRVAAGRRGRSNPVGEREAAAVLRQLVAAVAHCHDRDVVHRDIKLENIVYATKISF